MSRRTRLEAQTAAQRAPDPHAPPPLSQASRRGLLAQAGVTFLLAATAAGDAKARELDGDLLALVADYVSVVREGRARLDRMTLADHAADHAGFMRGNRYEDVLAARIAELPARTPEGLRAKARALVWMYGGDDDEQQAFFRRNDAMLASLFADVLGRRA